MQLMAPPEADYITKIVKLEGTKYRSSFFRVFVISCYRDYFFCLVPVYPGGGYHG